MLCFVRYTSLRRVDLSSRGVIPENVRVSFRVIGRNVNPYTYKGYREEVRLTDLLVAVILLLSFLKKLIASRNITHCSHCKPSSDALTSQCYAAIT